LGFVNEYRAERATAELHSRVHHTALVRRDGRFTKVDVTGLECDESILSGESTAAEKWPQQVNPDGALADSTDLALKGSGVRWTTGYQTPNTVRSNESMRA
jgi:P-type Mg2+ transporter